MSFIPKTISKLTDSFRRKKGKHKKGNKEESPCGNLHSRFTNSVEIQKNIYIVTAAIDFGTTYSGYAFSFQSNPDDICVNKNWGENLGCVTNKAPTSVLTSATDGQDECFEAFGYEAEQKYADDLEETNGDVKNYQMYRHFKMLLHNDKTISRSTKITSETGHETLALDVFSMAIEYLKDHLLQRINETIASHVDTKLVRWVLTVPAIWGDSAKQFMREAALKVDIKGYVSKGGLNDLHFKPRTKYLVIDAGGGTIDVSAHEIIDDDSVIELHVANGGPWGGIEVDKKFILLLNKLISEECVSKFKCEKPATFLHFMTLFEKVKKQISIDDKDSKMCLHLPWALGNMIAQYFNIDLASAINNRNVPGIKFSNDFLVIDHERSLGLFTETVKNVMDHIQKLLGRPKLQGLSYVMLVGGFGDCKVLQQSLKGILPSGVKMLVPAEAQLSIVKGAVNYGYNQMTVRSRIMNKTYGTHTMRWFDPKVHDENKKKEIEGVLWCDELVKVFVQKGDSVEEGMVIKEPYIAVLKNQPGMLIDIYSTEKDNLDEVVYTDAPYMHRQGEIYVEMPMVKNNRKDRKVILEIKFGGTEIKVKATDKDSGNTAETAIDFL